VTDDVGELEREAVRDEEVEAVGVAVLVTLTEAE